MRMQIWIRVLVQLLKKNIGANFTENTSIYAVQSGNNNIFSQMIEDGQSFDDLIDTLLIFHNYELAEYLKTNLGQVPNSLAENLLFGNFETATYLLRNGADINNICIIILSIFICSLFNSLSSDNNRYFMTLIFAQ